MVEKSSPTFDKLEKLKNKRRGGGGKPRISQHKKMYLILFNLPHVKHKVAGVPGFSAAEILRRASCSDRDKHILFTLLEKGAVYEREPKSSERGNGYFYKTDEGYSMEIIFEKLIK